MTYKEKCSTELILRDFLALDRTMLANERTLLAYQRTAVMLFISAITVIKLFEDNWLMVILGYILLPIALVVAVVGYVRFRRVINKIRLANKASGDPATGDS